MAFPITPWVVRRPSRGDWMVVGCSTLSVVSFFFFAGPMIPIVPFLLSPFAILWLSAPALRVLGWPASVVATVGCLVGLLGVVVYIDAFVWHADANSSLVLFFLPVYQTAAIGLAAMLAVIIWFLRSRRAAVRGDGDDLGA